MKNELQALLREENAYLQIKEAFALHHYIFTPENDILGRTGEYLQLEMLCINNGRKNGFARFIEARDTQGIIDEVEKAMEDIMHTYTTQLIRRWKGGLDISKEPSQFLRYM